MCSLKNLLKNIKIKSEVTPTLQNKMLKALCVPKTTDALLKLKNKDDLNITNLNLL